MYEVSEQPTTTFSGGKPFINDNFEYPLDEDGQALAFLFQIDLSSVDEKVKDFYNLHDKGFMQFYHGADEMYGAYLSEDFKDSVSKIIYLEEAFDVDFELPNILHKEASPLEDYEERTYYSGKVLNMQADPYSSDFSNDEDFDSYAEHYFEEVSEYYDFYLGGFPHFSQEEVRDKDSDLILLLGSDSVDKIMWGDCGFGCFFVSDKDLKEQKYDNSIVWWDCG